jgi:hypothetical protein
MRSRTELWDGCAESPRGRLDLSDTGRLPRWGLLLPGIVALAAAVMCAVPSVTLLGNDAAVPPVSGCIGPPHRLTGTWRVTYHPNAAVRVYTIGSTGVVRFEDFPAWKGTLVNRGARAGSDLLRFEGDADDRLERLTLLEDGRLLVEHYNPGATFLEEKRPDQIGLGDRIN